MLTITLVQRSKSPFKTRWRVWFTPHLNLDWMVSINLCNHLWCHSYSLMIDCVYLMHAPRAIIKLQFVMVSERFGDGDASQVGLDLEEVIVRYIIVVYLKS